MIYKEEYADVTSKMPEYVTAIVFQRTVQWVQELS